MYEEHSVAMIMVPPLWAVCYRTCCNRSFITSLSLHLELVTSMRCLLASISNHSLGSIIIVTSDHCQKLICNILFQREKYLKSKIVHIETVKLCMYEQKKIVTLESIIMLINMGLCDTFFFLCIFCRQPASFYLSIYVCIYLFVLKSDAQR